MISNDVLVVIMSVLLGAASEVISLFLSGHINLTEYNNGKVVWSNVAKMLFLKLAIVGFIIGTMLQRL